MYLNHQQDFDCKKSWLKKCKKYYVDGNNNIYIYIYPKLVVLK
jgi:hypothetical protein